MVSINTIGIGAAPDDGNGDPLRTAFDKSNSNDANLNAGLALTDINVSSLQAQASSLDVSVSSLQAQASSLDVSVSSLSANVSSNQVSVGSVNTRIGSIDIRIGSVGFAGRTEAIIVALSDETTDVTAGSAKATFRSPFAMVLTDVRGSATLPTSGSKAQFDVNVAGTSVFSATLTMDAGEETTTTAESGYIFSSSTPSIADDAQIVIDVDSVGSAASGKGFKVTLIGQRT